MSDSLLNENINLGNSFIDDKRNLVSDKHNIDGFISELEGILDLYEKTLELKNDELVNLYDSSIYSSLIKNEKEDEKVNQALEEMTAKKKSLKKETKECEKQIQLYTDAIKNNKDISNDFYSRINFQKKGANKSPSLFSKDSKSLKLLNKEKVNLSEKIKNTEAELASLYEVNKLLVEKSKDFIADMFGKYNALSETGEIGSNESNEIIKKINLFLDDNQNKISSVEESIKGKESLLKLQESCLHKNEEEIFDLKKGTDKSKTATNKMKYDSVMLQLLALPINRNNKPGAMSQTGSSRSKDEELRNQKNQKNPNKGNGPSLK